jgi:hypothetical protein
MFNLFKTRKPAAPQTKSFIVPVCCCLDCKKPLKWIEKRNMSKMSVVEMVRVASCCGVYYNWDSLTLIRPTAVEAASYDDAVNKILNPAETPKNEKN